MIAMMEPDGGNGKQCKKCGGTERYASGNCKRCSVARHRRYDEKNPEKLAEKYRRYREKNREKRAEYARRYREKNPEKFAEQYRRKQNRKKFELMTGMISRIKGMHEEMKTKPNNKHENE
jgi:hypothetical protein